MSIYRYVLPRLGFVISLFALISTLAYQDYGGAAGCVLLLIGFSLAVARWAE